MIDGLKIDVDVSEVCQKADAVFELVHRSATLPTDLSLSIEELLENAWEIAHRRQLGTGAQIIDLQAVRCARKATKSDPEALHP